MVWDDLISHKIVTSQHLINKYIERSAGNNTISNFYTNINLSDRINRLFITSDSEIIDNTTSEDLEYIN
jgi:hypothetical protein